jgi:hypothetical protein
MLIDIKDLKSELDNIVTDRNTRVLFKARPILNQSLNLDLITYLLEKIKANISNLNGSKRTSAKMKVKENEGTSKGVIVTIFRSHSFVHSLLKKLKVDVDRVVFIDPIYSISGDVRKHADQAIILPCPFARTFEDSFFEALDKVGEVDFLLIDDIVTLNNYWSRERIEAFLNALSKRLAEMGDPSILIIADSTKDGGIIDIASAICDRVIEVDGIKKMKEGPKVTET